MLDDKTFLGAVRALHDSADRLGQQTVTIQTDHLLRLVEMAERAGPRRLPIPGEGSAVAMTYTGTVWRHTNGSTSWFSLVQAEPHAGLDGVPTVHILHRAVVDGKRQRTHKSITTLAALLERYEQVSADDWPGAR